MRQKNIEAICCDTYQNKDLMKRWTLREGRMIIWIVWAGGGAINERLQIMFSFDTNISCKIQSDLVKLTNELEGIVWLRKETYDSIVKRQSIPIISFWSE